MSFSICIIFGAKKTDYAESVERYCSMVAPWAPCYVQYTKIAAARDVGKIRSHEEHVFSRYIVPHATTVALTEEGRTYTSSAFADWMGRAVQKSKPLVFCISGAYGFSEPFKKKCNEMVSLSPSTMPHQLALLVLTEQIYRAFTILKGHPYHK